MSEASDKLKALQAERAALAAAREQRVSQLADEELIAAEEQGLADDKAIDKAIAEHGPIGKRIAVVKTDMGAIVLKRPTSGTFKRFQDAGSMKHDALEQLVRPSVVHPTLGTFDMIMEALPATMLRCADAVSVLAGVRRDDVSAK